MPLKDVFVVVDMRDVDRINSSGIGILISINERLSQRNGRMVLFNLSFQVQTILDIISAGQFLEIYKDESEALTALDSERPEGLSGKAGDQAARGGGSC